MRTKIKDLQISKQTEKEELETKLKKLQQNNHQTERDNAGMKEQINKLNKLIQEEQTEAAQLVKEVGLFRKENRILKQKLDEF